jgi:hypothetical protein
MAFCPNTNLKEWKDLVSAQGENLSYFLWDKYKGNVPSMFYVQSTNQQIQIKPEIKKLFDSNPEMAAIGTVEQYSQYLDSIFPESNVKSIVYHHSSQKIEKFNKSFLGTNTKSADTQLGFFFSEDAKAIPAMVSEKNKQLKELGSDKI